MSHVSEFLTLITTLAAVGAFVISWYNATKLKNQSRTLDTQRDNLNTVKEQTDGIQDEMIIMAKAVSLAEGILKGRKDLLREQDQDKKEPGQGG